MRRLRSRPRASFRGSQLQACRRMTDTARVLQQTRIGALVGVYWMVAVIAPFMMLGAVRKPDRATTILFLAISAYFIYTGYRAWKLHWKSRFMLRIVVPALLFLVALVCAGVFAWST